MDPHATDSDPKPSDVGVLWIVDQFHRMFGNSHGDCVVGMALFNNKAGVGVSPLGVLQRLEQLKLKPSELWGIFKAQGGVSKEDTGIHEGDQHQALHRTWKVLCDRS
jgi:hypothetical protein